ncbi:MULTISPECIES: hypothetical protein [unclassified Pseudomonas]|uniref:hypothetical protein n=1 Tax=unclassified Pseudomonas TaxID=196821 RepID=UPI0025EC5D3C|nr:MULTISPECIES: hypothetical protein [unclassified Pseudomonas]
MTTFQGNTDAPVHLQWMAQTPNLEHLRIDELILPGSHNSGSDKQSPNFGVPQEYAQDVSPLEQLRHGIRVLDLRIAVDENYPEGDPARFQLFHLTSSGRTVAVDIVEAVRAFFAELESDGTAAREILILDFHQFEGFTDQAHAQLQAQVFNELGGRVIPFDMHHWTLGQIWEHQPGRNVVVAYNSSSVEELGWDGVTQRWPGENLFNTNTLKTFVDDVSKEHKAPFYLQAVQCAKYSLPFHTPSDLSHKIDQWFESVDENSYIQNFYIINTDWSLRSHLIANCRHANELRGARKLSHPDEHLQPTRR